jgi:hypothetical protein
MMLLPIPLLVGLALGAGPVSMQYEGPLKDALQQIAQKGGLNIVASGDLSEHVQVNLAEVTAEEALETIAEAYGLELTRRGKVLVLRPREVRAAKSPAPPVATPAVPTDLAPPIVPSQDDANQALLAGAAADHAREQAEADQERAEAVREQAEALAEAQQEQADAARELAEAHAQLEDTRRLRLWAKGPVTVEKGQVVNTAVAYGGAVVIEENAVVNNDAVAFGGDVVLKDNAVVHGDAVSFGGQVVRGANSVVGGETVSMGGASVGTAISKSVVQSQQVVKDEEEHGNRLAVFLLQFALFFGLGFVLILFAPQRMKALEATIRAEPGRNALAGLATIPASVLTCFTVVGIPMVVLAWVFLAPVAVAVGFAAIAHALGSVLPTWRLRRTQAVTLALGVLVMLLVFHLPVLGVMAQIGCGLVSLGAIIRTRFGQPPRGTPILETSPLGVGA